MPAIEQNGDICDVTDISLWFKSEDGTGHWIAVDPYSIPLTLAKDELGFFNRILGFFRQIKNFPLVI